MNRNTRLRRFEVLIDAPLLPVIEAAARATGVTNWAILPTVSGMVSGRAWHADELSDADRRMLFLTILSEPKAQALLDRLRPILDSHGLSLFISEVEVVRGERY